LALANSTTLTALTTLDVEYNPISAEGLDALRRRFGEEVRPQPS
jgi:hypothetical protein